MNNFILSGGGLTTNPSGNKVMLNIKDSTASTEYIDDEIHYTAGIIDMGQVGIQDDSTSNYDAKMTLNSGIVKSKIFIFDYKQNKTVSIEINGGLVYSKDETPLKNQSNQVGEVTINGGIIAPNNTTSLITSSGTMPKITINGGIFTANPSEYMADTSKIMSYKMTIVKPNTSGTDGDNNSFSTSVNYIVIPNNSDKEVYVYNNGIAIQGKNVLKVINADEIFADNKKLSDIFDEEYKAKLLNSFNDRQAIDIIPMYAEFENNDVDATSVNDLDDTYSLSLYLNKDTLDKIKDNNYALYQIDDDVNKIVDNAEIKQNHIDFSTNKLGMYALVVYEKNIPAPSPEPTSTPTTEENNDKDNSSTKVVTCAEVMGSKDWIWSESKKACVYKVTNTNSK